MTSEQCKYAVYFHANALEALGEAINPYLTQGPNGPHIVCNDIDTGGVLCEMNVCGKNADGKDIETEVMVPVAMIRMVLQIASGDGLFGFAPD
jgi:hypothetical protein